jgi:hypothetical protein
MRERIEELRRQINVLEWDQARNQLNLSKVAYLNKLKDELGKLETEYKATLPPAEASSEGLLAREL